MENANHEFTYLSGRAQFSVAHEAKYHGDSNVAKVEKPKPTPHPRQQNATKETVDKIQLPSPPSIACTRPIPLPRILKRLSTNSPLYEEPSSLQSSVFYIATPKQPNASTVDRNIILEFDPILQSTNASTHNSTFYIEQPKMKSRTEAREETINDCASDTASLVFEGQGIHAKSTFVDGKTINDVPHELKSDYSTVDINDPESLLSGSSLSLDSCNSASNSTSNSSCKAALTDSEGPQLLSNSNESEEPNISPNSCSKERFEFHDRHDNESLNKMCDSVLESPPPPSCPPPCFDFHSQDDSPPPLPPRPSCVAVKETRAEILSPNPTILQATCMTSTNKQPLKCTLSTVPPSPVSSNLLTEVDETHVQQRPTYSMLVENPFYLFLEGDSSSLSLTYHSCEEVKGVSDSDSSESCNCDFESGEPPHFPPPPLPAESSGPSSTPPLLGALLPSMQNPSSILGQNDSLFQPVEVPLLNNKELHPTPPCIPMKMPNMSYPIYQNLLGSGENKEGIYAKIKTGVQPFSNDSVLSPPPLPPRGQQRPLPIQPVPPHVCHPHVASLKKEIVNQAVDHQKPSPKDSKLSRLISNIPRHGVLYRLGRGSKDVTQKWIVLERGHLQCYADDKTDCPQDIFHKSDMVSVAKGAQAKHSNQELVCFEVVTRTSKDRPEIFGAKYLSECDSWMQHIIQAIAPIPEAMSYRGILKAGYALVRLSVTATWQERWIVLKEKCLTVSSDTEDNLILDLRKVISMRLFDKESRMNDLDEEVPVFLINYPAITLYAKSVRDFDTADWFTRIKDVVYDIGPSLENQQMTHDGIPVIVDKCIKFISTYGITSKGIYRQSSTNSRISKLLDNLVKDAHKIHLQLDVYSEYDVANALKRFFRTLPEPIMTKALYSKWVAIDRQTLDHYLWLLSQLPEVNCLTLKRLIGHLYSISNHSEQNLMTASNLAQVFAPTLLAVDNDINVANASTEIAVVADLITHFPTLFGLSTGEIEKEEKIQKALRDLREAKKAQKPAGDILVGIYIYHRQWGKCLNMKLSPTMTTLDVCSYAAQQTRIKEPLQHLSVFEVVCDGELERPLHHSEVLLSVTLRWARWSDADARDNYLVIKKNDLFESVLPLTRQPLSMFGELRMADIKSKSFKKCMFEFKNAKLAYYKDAKISQPLGSWNIEDLTWYVGYESRRQPPTRWAITFIEQNAVVRRRTKESPYFGYTICFCSEDEFHKWVATLLIGQYPNGIFPRRQPLDLLS